MQYIKGEIFNKKSLIFKDGKCDTRIHGHPVVVLDYIDDIDEVFYVKMISDVTKLAKSPSRYMIIKNTKANGLDRPSLICLDEIYRGSEGVLSRGEISQSQYIELIQRIYSLNTKNNNKDDVFKEWLDFIGEIDDYKTKAVNSW